MDFERVHNRFTTLAAVCCLGLLLWAEPLRAEESIDQSEPIPSSVDEVTGPLEQLGEVKFRRLPRVLPWIKGQLKDAPAFFRDTTMDLSVRSYYSRASKYDGTTISEAWALGGALNYRSGWLLDRVSVGASLYTSQPLYAPAGSGGSGVLQPDQSGITVLGQLYGRIKLTDQVVANLYRYADYKTPYLSKDDGKIIPYSFEGYFVKGTLGETGGAPQLVFGGGYFTKIKDKTSENFIWMSEKAGATVKRGVSVLGGLYTAGRFSLGAVDYYSNDIINIGYTEGSFTKDLDNGLGIRLAAQFTDQRSVGSELLTGTGFSTNQFGVKSDLSYAGAILTLAYTLNSRGYDLQKPWSGYPGFTSAMINNYKGAGYNAWYAKVSYDFSESGLEGVAAYALVTHGWGQVDQVTKAPLPGENELNADIQWRPKLAYLTGLRLRVRYGLAHQYEGAKQYSRDGRVMVTYDFPLM